MMPEEVVVGESLLARHRFIFLIIFSITAALLLVAVAMALYNSSGAAQLDLSRPGYAGVRDKAISSNTYDGFPSIGPIDDSSLKQFRTLYDSRIKDVQALDAFGGDSLSDTALGIDAPPAQPSTN